MYLKPGTQGKSKADVRWSDGVYLGMVTRSDEYMIGTENGVITMRSIMRHGMKELQWGKDRFEAVAGVPWEPFPGRDGIEIRSNIVIVERTDEPKMIPEPEEKEVVRRRAGIRKEDVMEFGATPGCPGCTAANRGLRRNHNDMCRKRLE